MKWQQYLNVSHIILIDVYYLWCSFKQMHKISGSGKARAKFDKYENKRYDLLLLASGNS